MAKKVVEVTLPADAKLTADQFSVDADGNVVVKNPKLAEVLKTNLQSAVKDPNVNEVKIGVVIDF
jgi:hypothetical protein